MKKKNNLSFTYLAKDQKKKPHIEEKKLKTLVEYKNVIFYHEPQLSFADMILHNLVSWSSTVT